MIMTTGDVVRVSYDDIQVKRCADIASSGGIVPVEPDNDEGQLSVLLCPVCRLCDVRRCVLV